MPCISAERRERLTDQLISKQTQLTNLYSAMENFDGVASYKFDSGEGLQQTKYRSMDEIQDIIDRIEAQIDRIQRILYGTGLVNITLRRKGYCGYRRPVVR